MAEYIDKEIALSLVQPDAPEDEKSTITIATAKKLVRSIIYRTPTADVAPVRHGRWEAMHYEGGILDGTNFDKCSVCGYERIFEDEKLKTAFKYCPNCGAKMDEKEE